MKKFLRTASVLILSFIIAGCGSEKIFLSDLAPQNPKTATLISSGSELNFTEENIDELMKVLKSIEVYEDGEKELFDDAEETLIVSIRCENDEVTLTLPVTEYEDKIYYVDESCKKDLEKLYN